MKPLPTTTSTFRDIIEGGYVYIDKTEYIYGLARLSKGAWFLSRPRRFGKSLFISTLEALFRGNREIFQGLWIDSSDYDWQEYPVIHIDFNLSSTHSATELQENIKRDLRRIASEHDVELADGPYYAQFADLIFALAKQKQVVILIDEYDKPLTENLDNLDESREILQVLKGFYGVIKAMDRYIRMSFITGISKVSVFSNMNNITDLTIHSNYATVCGFTEEEIRHYLAEYIDLFAKKEDISPEDFIEKMRHRYNGFCFSQDGQNVYHPASIINLFFNQRFSNYWFETGSPSFLIKQIMSGNYSFEELSNQKLSELTLSTFGVDRLELMPLLVQTGYMTIKKYDPDSQRYLLGYPNWEVENAFMVHLLDAFSDSNKNIAINQ